MKKAYVENGVVIEAVENPAVFVPDYAAKFTLDCPDEVTAGWTYDRTEWKAPVIPPEPVPQIISPRQCRLQLLSESLLDEVEAAISNMPQAAQIEWEYALDIKRTYGLVTAMQALLGKDDAEMDTFFTEAYKL